MSEWEFTSLLPLVNKDVELLGDYKCLSKKVQCRCKKCGELFSQTPSALLNRQLHSNCKYSYNNILNSKSYEHVKNRLHRVWSENKSGFDFITPYVDENTPVELRCKSCGKILHYYPNKTKYKFICSCKVEDTDIIHSERSRQHIAQHYRLYDKDLDVEIYMTLDELLEYSGHSIKSITFKRLCQLKWFKKRFSIKRKRTSSAVENIENGNLSSTSNSTGIIRKCKYMPQCFITGEHKCTPCPLKQNTYYSIDEYNDIIVKEHPHIEFIDKFINKQTPIRCKCKTCGYIWKEKPSEILNDIKCSNCTSSKGEQLIAAYLSERNVRFEREKSFSDCVSIKPLRFDFFLSDYNAAIEFDGIQHFQPVKFGHTSQLKAKQEFLNLQKRDSIKDSYCKKKGIRLLRIRYDDSDKVGKIDKFLLIIQCS